MIVSGTHPSIHIDLGKDEPGRPLDPRGLARLLRPYEIKPTTVRVGNATAKGYSRADMWDAWQRYL